FESELAATGGEAARRYLAGRGLKPQTIQRFRLGFAPNRRGALLRHLKAEGIEEPEAIAAGLVKKDEEGRLREYFFDRVVFPIADKRGRVVAFGGRTLGDGQPKYLNSPDGVLFHKGRLLYNLANAAEAARRGEAVLVAEGYMDVIALAEAGFEGAVAPLGTAVTEEQLGELWKLVDEPVLCLDGDAAGRRAALRAADRALPLLAPAKTLRFAFLPGGEDPDSLLRSGGLEALKTAFAAARPLADVVYDKVAEPLRLETPESWAALKAGLEQAVGTIRDASVGKLYRDHLLDRFYEARRKARGFSQGRPGRQPWRGAKGWRGPPEPPVASFGKLPRPERLPVLADAALLAIAINHPMSLIDSLEEVSALELASRRLQRLRDGLITALAEAPDLDREALTSHLSRLGLDEALAAVLSPAVYAFCASARPEAPMDLARQALDAILADHAARQANEAVEEARRRLADEPSEENLARVQAALQLQRQAEARRGGGEIV
ncbi:MAG TPA: toprim domain-containing protein, partial [Kiloniellales bacterium]|nr:toprim domain-containing protein [Kiloniellales bacterium]